ncbi:MAG: transporter substrate-binding domain-containing protein [Clostridia bacterium]|nr:transporter substrate-binding domain-containing protein [Clostridia bacterium]
MSDVRRLTAILLLISMILSFSVFYGCAGVSPGDDSTDTTDDDTQEPEQLKMTVAICFDGEPYVYGFEDQAKGICIDIIAAAAEYAEMELTFKVVDKADLFSGLLVGEYDAVLASENSEFDNDEYQNFLVSTSLASNNQVTVVSKDSGITRLYDLVVMKGKRIGYKLNSMVSQSVKARFGEDNTVSYDSYKTGVEAVKNGEINGMIVDAYAVNILDNEVLAQDNLKVLTGGFYEDEYVLFFQQDSLELQEKLNSAIGALYSNMKISAIINDYIQGGGSKRQSDEN